MILKPTLKMLRNIANWVAAILLIVLGWTCGHVFDAISYFIIDNSINVADVLGIIVECVLAVFILRVFGKKDEENRVEKDFYICEYDKAQDAVNETERICATQTTLSLVETNYCLTRCRKIIVKLWKQISELHPDFKKQNEAKQIEMLSCLKRLNTRLTDTKYYVNLQGVVPLKITNGKIYLNSTIKPGIDDEISELKRCILEMKVLVNKM